MGRRTFRLKPIVAAVAAAMATGVQALPTAPTVTSGSASFNQSGSTLTVTNSPNAIINWGSFSIGQSEATRFVQQSAASAVLNRVVGQDPSLILGSLQSNGRVFLINPNGVLFGQGARIDTAGLIASSLALSDADFLSGRLAFTGAGNEGKVENAGTITTPSGGAVYLIAPKVENSGVIHAPNGDVLLAAGASVEIADVANPALRVLLTAPEGEVVNLGQVIAESGRIGLHGGMVSNQGALSASSAVAEGGRIYLKGRTVDLAGRAEANGLTQGGKVAADGEVIFQTASISASGATGGEVSLTADRVLQAGTIDARGTSGDGGRIEVIGATAVVQTIAGTLDASGSEQGGTVRVQAANGTAYLSGAATSTGDTGGRIELLGRNITLAAATVDASGNSQGGTVLVGGDFQGSNPAIQNAETTAVNASTHIDVSAKIHGDGGKAIVWSDRSTQFSGTISARGADAGGNGGFVEVSGKENLAYSGLVDAGAKNGTAGSLLLDPKSITIDANAAAGSAYFDLLDPNPASTDQYGTGTGNVTELANGNLVVTSPNDDFGGADAGAVFLFDRTTGGLISALYGSATADIQSAATTTLNNGNFVLVNPFWNNSAIADAGAVTFGNATTGVSGVISAGNSLVGGTANDRVGSDGITALTNGNYVVNSRNWTNGGVAGAGAVTWGSGTTGVSGLVSAANSLVGSTAGDMSSNAVYALSNGNYVVSNRFWNNAGVVDAGAVAWGNGTTGTSGVVSAANSLVGATLEDYVGDVWLLSNGNYVVSRSTWNNAGAVDAGFVSWVDGSIGKSGVVSAANSVVGTTANDNVGYTVAVLSDGDFVVSSPGWTNGGVARVGAATWFNGTTGQMATGSGTGTLSAANSLIGSATNDQVGFGGSGTVELTNGNYVVSSPDWDNAGITDAGAVTWGNGAAGTVGVVSAANSLVGDHNFDSVGADGITALSSGNYLVQSQSWFSNRGAVTWGNGTTGIVGAVDATNSLVGTIAGGSGDFVGSAVYSLTNGNVVIVSDSWNGSRGAVTWMNGATGQLSDGTSAGALSAANSLVGSTAFDEIGTDYFSNGITVLTNGNYVVQSPYWTNGAVADAGAVTWINGATGQLVGGATGGAISASNSLVGVTAFDQIGFDNFVTALSNGNYVVQSPYWDNGGIADAGAVTWGNGASGTVGTISAANSLIGTTAFKQLGYYDEVVPLTNGNYLVAHANWSTFRGSVTWVNGANGQLSDGASGGVIDPSHSLVGSTDSDNIGIQVTVLNNGNAVVNSPDWDNPGGGLFAAGAATWINGSNGQLVDGSIGGAVSSSNSLVGASASDRVSTGGMFALSNGNYLVSSPYWNGSFGAVTWADGTTGLAGNIAAGNSLLGDGANEYLGWFNTMTILTSGHYVVSSPAWSADTGRVVLGKGTVVGTGTVNDATFANTGDSGVNYTLTPSALLATLNAGTAVTLQANNDITITSPISVNNVSGNGGALTLQAGRSILLNANITTDNGNLVLSANDPAATLANRDAGAANISIASGVTVDTGTGSLSATIGSLSTAGAISNAGILNIGSGSITGNLTNTGTVNLNNGTLSVVKNGAGNGVFTNSGTFNLTGNGSINLDNSGSGYPTFDNAAGGILNINTTTGGYAFQSDPGVQGGIVTNAGTINVNTSYTSWEAAFTNTSAGLLSIAANNAVSMQNGQTLQGTVNLGAGATLWVSERHGTNALFSGTTIGGTGSVQVAAGIGPVADFNNVSATGATLMLLSGTANILGPTSFANLTQSGGTLDGAGTLTIGGALNQTGGTQTGSGSTVLSAGGTGTLNGVSNSRLFSNQGTLSLTGANLAGGLSNSGVLNLTSSSSVIGGTFSQTGTVSVASGATLQRVGGMTNDGVMSGSGTIELGGPGNSLINNGTLRPGSSPGVLSINGDLVLGSTGVLVAELGGTSQGTSYDWISVVGNATLGGTLQATLFGPFAPAVGNTFDVLTTGGVISGTFGSLSTPPGYPFSANYGSSVFGLGVTGLPAAAPPAPPGINNVVANVNATINLAALSYETPLLYSSGQSSSTASGSGVNTQTAEQVLPALLPPPAESVPVESGLSASAAALMPVMNQLLLDANRQEENNESRLICR